MEKKYLLTVGTKKFRNIISIDGKDLILMDENKFHEIFHKAIDVAIDKLILEYLVDEMNLEDIFPDEWDVLENNITVKFDVQSIENKSWKFEIKEGIFIIKSKDKSNISHFRFYNNGNVVNMNY